MKSLVSQHELVYVHAEFSMSSIG